MNTAEDPETRIADLERSASFPAGAGAPPDAPATGMRLGWIVLGLLIAGLVVGGVMILADRSGRPVAGRPTTPPVAAGDGPTIGPTRTASATPAPDSPTPPRPRPAPTGAPTPKAGGPISVSGVESRRTIDCADGVLSVNISGVKNTVVLTGRCARVEVSGIENRVTIEEAGAIDVSGLNNVVRFASGTPELSKSGIGNTLERG